ncbi:MAG TPA: HAMP domain-containing sensor histidine kinase [Longimicrobiaceae bacterium]|nr:HAMP domain-containing sensor histidine kinase [Longimicrobiaceae bacterium]
MPPRGSFERRLLIVLVLFSLLPSLVLLGVGTYALSRAVSLAGTPAAWERVAESGRELIERVERSGDPELAQAAARHRSELSESLLQARRWEFLLTRTLALLPLAALLLALLLGWLAVRAARSMARGLSRPIRRLVRWSQLIARGEPLPAASTNDPAKRGEFGILRDAFRTMAAELEASRQRALEAERTRTWIAMARRVAHELKNPLTPLRLAVHTLSRSEVANSPAAREALEVIGAESDRLDELARAFAQFGRLPEGPPSEIDLRELLDYLLRTHLPPAITWRLDAPEELPLIQGHHDALARAFANLLLNAADALDGAEGTVHVTLEVAAEGEAIEARIADSGPGIPPEHLERIWEPDFSTRSRGTGLGLTLVRQTVQAHGGSISAGNRPAGGAEFRIQLPLGDNDSAGSAFVASGASTTENE